MVVAEPVGSSAGTHRVVAAPNKARDNARAFWPQPMHVIRCTGVTGATGLSGLSKPGLAGSSVQRSRRRFGVLLQRSEGPEPSVEPSSLKNTEPTTPSVTRPKISSGRTVGSRKRSMSSRWLQLAELIWTSAAVSNHFSSGFFCVDRNARHCINVRLSLSDQQ